MVNERKKIENNSPVSSMASENCHPPTDLKSSSKDSSSSSASDVSAPKSSNISLESLAEVTDSSSNEPTKFNGHKECLGSTVDVDGDEMPAGSNTINEQINLEENSESNGHDLLTRLLEESSDSTTVVLYQANDTTSLTTIDHIDKHVPAVNFNTFCTPSNLNSQLISFDAEHSDPISVNPNSEILNGDEAATKKATIPPNYGQIIELNLSNVKTNFNEFDTFMRLYLYVSDVFHSDSTYKDDSMELYFQTMDEAFNRIHNSEHLSDPVYKMALDFRHGIVRQNCSHQVKKKSIEIHLEKAQHNNWGSIGISSRRTATTNNNSSFKSRPSAAAMAQFAHNKWTPCAMVNEGTSEAKFNNLEVVAYEEPIEPLLVITDETKGKFYGYTGLDNLGNTCFMNSTLQCLSNIDPLRDYFLSGQFQRDINKDNPLGSGGVIVRAYANFLKQMWMGKQTSFSPVRIKALTGEKITSMFLGYHQHDAQEFMSYFLDAIHEDLNMNQNKPKIDYKEDDEKAEKELFEASDLSDAIKCSEIQVLLKQKADNMWQQYRLFNNSIVIDLFCGQFKSILTCPDCTKKSIMFDPFLYIPLPIPPAKTTYEVIFFARHEETGMCKGSTRFEVVLPHNATAGELLNIISSKTNVSTKTMRMIEQQDDHISPKFLNSNWLLSDLRNDTVSSSKNRPLLVFEVYKDNLEEYTELCVIQRSLAKMPPRHFNLVNDKRIGLPFIISVKTNMLTYHHLCSVLCSYASHSVTAYRSNLVNASATANESFSLRTFHADEFYQNQINLEKTSSLPHFVYFNSTNYASTDVLSPFVLRKPQFGGPYRNSADEEIMPPLINESQSDDSDLSEDSETSTVVNSSDEQIESSTSPEEAQDDSADELESEMPQDAQESASNPNRRQIFQYDSDYVLDLGNSSYYICCDWIDIPDGPPSIVVNLSETSLQTVSDLSLSYDDDITLDDCLKLFNEPEVLGPQNCWRCPSCKDLREATKQISFWRFPQIVVFQLKKFEMKNAIFRKKIHSMIKYPIHGLDLSNYGDTVVGCNGEKVKPIYDLYAVVNHMGDAFMGHYTAFARSFDGKLGWRYFDDTRVVNADESRVVSHNAYLLFYKCRTSE